MRHTISRSLHVASAIAVGLLLVGGCRDGGTEPDPDTQVASLVRVSGNQQNGFVAQELPNALEVRAQDGNGRPVEGATVNWSVAAGGGTITSSSTTDALGRAIAVWTMGTVVDSPPTALAVVGGHTATFTAIPQIRGSALARSLRGDRQTGSAGERLADSLVLALELSDGTPIVGAMVTWTTSEGSGSVSPTSNKTDAAGRATAAWTLGRTGPQSAMAAVSGFSPPTVFQAILRPGRVTRLQLVSAPEGDVRVGTVDEVAVRLFDANGNLVPSQLVQWSVQGNGFAVPTQGSSDTQGIARTRLTFPTVPSGEPFTLTVRSGDAMLDLAWMIVAAPD